VLLGAALACGAVVAWLGWTRAFAKLTQTGLVLLVGAPTLALIVLVRIALSRSDSVLCLLRGARRRSVRLISEAAILALSLIVVEALTSIWVTEIQSVQRTLQNAAEKLGVPFDARSMSELVTQLRESGVDAVPGLSREWPRVFQGLPAQLYPLSHASWASVVECNEGGQYLVYKTDEFGFHNPLGLVAARDVSMAVVGESLALGYCVPPSQSLVGILRQVYPRTANFAMAGSGTLSTLASFREYVEPLRPPIVLWVVNPHYVVAEDERATPVHAFAPAAAPARAASIRNVEVGRVARSGLVPPGPRAGP
jgi:hypothetical protein